MREMYMQLDIILSQLNNNGDEDTASYINNIMQMNDLSSDTIHSGKNLVIYY